VQRKEFSVLQARKKKEGNNAFNKKPSNKETAFCSHKKKANTLPRNLSNQPQLPSVHEIHRCKPSLFKATVEDWKVLKSRLFS
jgi:hypothetical protein